MASGADIPEKMRVARYYRNSDVRLDEMPVPKIGNDEILVKIIASGICGSDVMEWYRIKKAPLVLGHEIAGDVAKVGADVKRYKPGDRVFVSHHVPCNICDYCLDGHHSVCDTLRATNFDPGGFAEYVRVPKINVDRGVFVLPDAMTYDEGVFIEPLACVYRGQRQAGMRAGKKVLVLGSGLSGLLHIQLARALGAGLVFATDISDYRKSYAKKLGADAVFSAKDDVPTALKRANSGKLADIVIVCTGALSAIDQAFGSVERGGTILFFAPPDPGKDVVMPLNNMWKNEITTVTSYAGSPSDITTAIELIRGHRVDVNSMITHRLPLAQTQLGFGLTAEGKESVKVIIEPQE